jgi:hypothetical protein
MYNHVFLQGAIVYLSLQISRCHQKIRERKEKPAYARNCLISQISQIAHCLPSTVRQLGNKKETLNDSGKIPIERVGHVSGNYNSITSKFISFQASNIRK